MQNIFQYICNLYYIFNIYRLFSTHFYYNSIIVTLKYPNKDSFVMVILRSLLIHGSNFLNNFYTKLLHSEQQLIKTNEKSR